MLIFSDIHFGIGNNSDDRLKDAVDVIKWIVEEGKKHGEKICVFAGDWIHQRYLVDVKTMSVAKAALSYLCDNFETVYVAPGNHDYYDNNSDAVSSAYIFENVRSNIKIVRLPEEVEVNGKRVLITNWYYNPVGEVGRYDAMIGHFEYVGGKMNGGFSKVGHDPRSMLAVAPLIFTGHYHLTSELEREDGKIVSIGSPLQQDWGDYNDKKRIIIFDGTEYKSIYNEVSPTFVKIQASKLVKNSEEKIAEIFKIPQINSGFVKIVSDDPAIDFNAINSLVNIGSSVKMRSLSIDYSSVNSSASSAVNDGMEELSSKDTKTYVHEFIDKEISENPKYKMIDAKMAHELVEKYFSTMV